MKVAELESVPDSYVIHVSAVSCDTEYQYPLMSTDLGYGKWLRRQNSLSVKRNNSCLHSCCSSDVVSATGHAQKIDNSTMTIMATGEIPKTLYGFSE